MNRIFIIFFSILSFSLLFISEAPAQKKGLGQLPKKVEKKIDFGDGEICTRKESKGTFNVDKQCEVGYYCDTGKPIPPVPLKDLLKLEYVKITVPGQECATFDIDRKLKGNPCRCSGGNCYCYSDIRLKQNIYKIGKLKNGLNVYLFNYIWESSWTIGVMAHEVKEIKPKAVITINGFDLVDYSQILK